jgi:hypothetical protein
MAPKPGVSVFCQVQSQIRGQGRVFHAHPLKMAKIGNKAVEREKCCLKLENVSKWKSLLK